MLGGLDGHGKGLQGLTPAGRHSRDGLLGHVEGVDVAAPGYDVGLGFRKLSLCRERRLGL